MMAPEKKDSPTSQQDADNPAVITCLKCQRSGLNDMVECCRCEGWYFFGCLTYTATQRKILSNPEILWSCDQCKVKPLATVISPSNVRTKQVNQTDGPENVPDAIITDLKTRLDRLETTMAMMKIKVDLAEADNADQKQPHDDGGNAWQVVGPKNKERPQLQTIIREELEERKQIEAKKLNLIVYNIPDNANSTPDEDQKTCIKLFQHLGVETSIETSVRLGREYKGKNRLIKVTLNNIGDRKKLLANATNLRKIDTPKPYDEVYIRPDLTTKQLEQSKNLRDQMRTKILESPLHIRWVIRDGQVQQKQ